MERNNLVEMLKALGESNRLAVAVRLADREWGAGELLGQLGMSQPSLSRHLKVLREAGVIRERRTGRNAYYQLADDELPRLVVALAGQMEGPGGLGADKNMRNDESNSTDAGEDPDDDLPKSGSIEDWLL